MPQGMPQEWSYLSWAKTANGIYGFHIQGPLFGWEEVSNPCKELLLVIHSLKNGNTSRGTKHMIEIINDHRNSHTFRHPRPESLASMLVPLACKVWFPSSPTGGATLHETQPHSCIGQTTRWEMRTIGPSDASSWKVQSWAEPSQTQSIDSGRQRWPLPSHYQGEGTEFLERVHNCADRKTW